MFPQLKFEDPDKLRGEFTDYQVTDSKKLPQEKRVDRFWGLIGRNETRFSELARLMKALLCIPHSNASSERSFSMVKKIVTENRMSMNNSTLCSLLSCKINHTGLVSKYTPSKRALRAAKSATYNYNTSKKK